MQVHSIPRLPLALGCLLLTGALSLAAQPPNGTYRGTTGQGKSITVEVSGGQVTSWVVSYQCPFFSGVQAVFPGSCTIIGNHFSCGSLVCSPFVGSSRIEGTFSGGQLSGTIDISHRPGTSSSCCVLNDIGWNAAVEGGGQVPDAAFNWSPNEPAAGQSVQFTDTSSGAPTSWNWDFGDGTTSSEQNPVHTFDLSGDYAVELEVSNGAGSDSETDLVTVVDASTLCVPGDTTLCLNEGRFKVEASWRDFRDRTGMGHVVPFGSDNSGMFWFFGEDNWEMLIKVLDGCGNNNHFWVFAAATTTVEYTLKVKDTQTGAIQEYFNPLRQRSAAIADTSAFATCP